MHTEVKELREAHSSWEEFEEALQEAYEGCPKSRGRRNFNQWVASAKTHRGAIKEFLEFKKCSARLPKWEQRLVGVYKVLLFVMSIDQAERMAIEIELEDNDGANGLTEDSSKVKRVYRWLDKKRSAKGKRKMTRDGAPSQQEVGAQKE